MHSSTREVVETCDCRTNQRSMNMVTLRMINPTAIAGTKLSAPSLNIAMPVMPKNARKIAIDAGLIQDITLSNAGV